MKMYRITGSNLFNQWESNTLVLNEFSEVFNYKTKSKLNDKGFLKLVQINWSYNIYQNDCTFFVSGFWGGKESQIVKIPLPQKCQEFIKDLMVVGNDYKLFFIHKTLKKLWLQDLEDHEKVKELTFNEIPIEINPKRRRKEFKLQKVVATNNSMLYLTESGEVYQGMLPSLVDTNHCIGKVCDIQCGYEHFLLLTDAGTVYTWGNGRCLAFHNISAFMIIYAFPSSLCRGRQRGSSAECLVFFMI